MTTSSLYQGIPLTIAKNGPETVSHTTTMSNSSESFFRQVVMMLFPLLPANLPENPRDPPPPSPHRPHRPAHPQVPSARCPPRGPRQFKGARMAQLSFASASALARRTCQLSSWRQTRRVGRAEAKKGAIGCTWGKTTGAYMGVHGCQRELSAW